MEIREKIVKKDLERKGYIVSIGDYITEPGIPDFKCFNFNTKERFFVEVKNKKVEYTKNQEEKIKSLILNKFEVRLAIVDDFKINYYLLDKDLHRNLIEIRELPKPREVINLKCKNCNYEWESRKKNPKCCPKCKSYDWNKEKEDE